MSTRSRNSIETTFKQVIQKTLPNPEACLTFDLIVSARLMTSPAAIGGISNSSPESSCRESRYFSTEQIKWDGNTSVFAEWPSE